MSKLESEANEASREYKDVQVLFDRELLAEQKRLFKVFSQAKEQYTLSVEEGYDGDPRFALHDYETAKTALEGYLKSISDRFVVIRVVEVPDHEWRAIRATNPLPEDPNTHTYLDDKYGLNAIACTKAALELTGLEVDGDVTSKPTPEIWKKAFANLSSGDWSALALAQIELNETVYSGGYAAAKKD